MNPIFHKLREAIVEAEGVERELTQARREIERLADENVELCDTVHELQSSARRAGLEASAREALEMIVRYQAEGDSLDSMRVVACLRRALDAMAAAKEAA